MDPQLTSIVVQAAQLSTQALQEAIKKGVPSSKLPDETMNKIVELEQRRLSDVLSDLPANRDSLGLDALVQTLSNIILAETTQTPISIGLDGKWGTGKTSLLKMVEEQARLTDTPCIWLNAWSLETAENLITSVASEIQREAKSKYPSGVDWQEIVRSTTTLLANVASALIPGGGNIEDMLSRTKQSPGVTKASLDRTKDIAELASIATTHRSFEDLVGILLRESKYPNPRLVVFIDDIDRALPDQIATILKNLKLVLEIPQCVFVLAMDMDIVANAIESYYLKRSTPITVMSLGNVETDADITINQVSQGQAEILGQDFGYNYLEKLIQIRVEVPSLTRQTIYAYLDEIGITPEVKEIIHWTPDHETLNPRRLKRYINWLSISLQLINSLPMPQQVQNVTALRAMAIRRDYPELYDYLLRSSPEMFLGANQLFLNSLNAQRAIVEASKDEFIEQVIEYLNKIPQQELLEFDKFVRKNPILDARRRSHRLDSDTNN